MAKNIDFSPRAKLKKGLDKVADAVKITIGPKGRNVAVDRGYDPLITNDGGTIAQDIQFKDKVENMGAQIIKGVIRKTSEKVGGGRTASAILTQAIVTEGLKHVENGMNMSLIKKGMQQAVEDITANLKANSKLVSTKEEIKQIATISTESEELGQVISDVIENIGKDGIVTVEESQAFGITQEITEGLKFDKGYISPYMVTNQERMEAELKDVAVLVTDKKISIWNEIVPTIKRLVEEQKRNSLVIICEDYEGDALNKTVLMKLSGQFNLLAIKAPGYIDKSTWLEDIAKCVGTEVVSASTGISFDKVTLGNAKKVLSTKDSTVIIGGAGNLQGQIDSLKILLENTDSVYEQDKLKQRIATLSGSVAIIKVGAATESEVKYLKQKIEDGVNESKRALEEGIVVGGDCAFIHASRSLSSPYSDRESTLGYNMILKAVEAPLRQIVINSNDSPDVIVGQIKNHLDATSGYNALTNEVVGDMYSCGIIDALKVTRTVLENAVSGASMFLTIEASISDEPEEPKQQSKIEY